MLQILLTVVGIIALTIVLVKLIDKFIPAQVKVIKTVRLKYSCRTCEKDNTNTPIKK